jgi:hypothetical protein
MEVIMVTDMDRIHVAKVAASRLIQTQQRLPTIEAVVAAAAFIH